jgi:hypothetical protein
LLLAYLVGWITESWIVWLVAFAILLAINVYIGEIRPSKRR